MKTKAFGAWKSPITPDLISRGQIALAEPLIRDDTIFWLESRPWEQGRTVLVMQHQSQRRDLVPAGYSVRSRAQEYGGGAWTLAGDYACFVNESDQVIYQIGIDGDPAEPVPLTPADGRRYADLHFDAIHSRLLAVCEDHRQPDSEPKTLIVAINLEPGVPAADQRIAELVSGDDFYASPRVSPDGGRISWISWNHPHMPWQGSALYLGELDNQGLIGSLQCLIAESDIAVFQPDWIGDDELVFVADFGEYWNLYRWTPAQGIHPFTSLEAECGLPLWNYGMSTWARTGDGEILCCINQQGDWRLIRIGSADESTDENPDQSTDNKSIELFDLPFTHLTAIRGQQGQAVMLAASPLEPSTLIMVNSGNGDFERIHASASMTLDPGDISRPRPVSYPTGDQYTAHGYFYPPRNRHYQGPAEEKPPLVVLCHGGPTSATSSAFNLKVQYWTSRGFAVMDLNYRGSTGYGKSYRNKLNGNWGISDVEDACAAAEYAATQGWVDRDKLIIRGSSAGGYTVLAALTFGETFTAGCCIYGIGDLTALARDTHKFESRYLESLVAPWPQGRQIYEQRSPLNHVRRLNCPVIFFQGLKDKVVPPDQTESMANALRSKGIPTWYQSYPEEGHGFRRAENIVDAYERELAFYSRIFGFPNTSSITLKPEN